jgi:CHAT domain-containing protein
MDFRSVSDMYFKFLTLGVVSALTVFSEMPAMANTTYSECNIIAAKLNLETKLCNAQESINRASIQGINDSDSLRRLGVSLRKLGYLNSAKDILERSLEIQPKSIEIRLSLANLTQAQYRRSLALVDLSGKSVPNLEESDNALEFAKKGLSEYLEILKNNPNQAEAALNWINLWSNLKGSSELKILQIQNLSLAQSIIKQINIDLSQNNNDENLESRLILSESLFRVSSLDSSFLTKIKNNSSVLIAESYRLNNLKLISKSEGFSGRLYLLENQEDKAIKAFSRAYSGAESIRAYDLSYKWARELGKIYVKQQNLEKGIKFYTSSIDRIENVRDKIKSLSTDIQYGFRENIEPIYKEYLTLLSRNPQSNFNTIIKINEKLQVGELEDYLRCNNLRINSLLSLKPKESPDSTLYFIRLSNAYAILSRSKIGEFKHHFIDKAKTDALLTRINRYAQGESFLESTNSKIFRDVSSQLYDQLIRPIKDDLPKEGHLVLAIDSSLQSLPWALLYDGQKYLIETYSLSVALGAELQAPSTRQNIKVTGLIAGSSQFPNNPEFSSLPAVPQELNAVSSELKGKTLLDSKFTSKALLNNAANVDFLHLASHGQFSSNPENTFLLDWNGKFKLSQLQFLIKDREKPLDLLVLSACDTAKGDRRALLGLAGTAIQSGARSTIASLWLVNDASQVMLMQEFYTQLLKNKKTKGEALRLAQLKLLKSGQYSSPYYWSGIVLLGSWL